MYVDGDWRVTSQKGHPKMTEWDCVSGHVESSGLSHDTKHA